MYYMAAEGWNLQGGMRRRGSETQGLLESNGSSFSGLSVESVVLQEGSSEVQDHWPCTPSPSSIQLLHAT